MIVLMLGSCLDNFRWDCAQLKSSAKSNLSFRWGLASVNTYAKATNVNIELKHMFARAEALARQGLRNVTLCGDCVSTPVSKGSTVLIFFDLLLPFAEFVQQQGARRPFT